MLFNYYKYYYKHNRNYLINLCINLLLKFSLNFISIFYFILFRNIKNKNKIMKEKTKIIFHFICSRCAA